MTLQAALGVHHRVLAPPTPCRLAHPDCCLQAALSQQGLSQTGATLISASVITPNCSTAPNYTAAQTGRSCPKPVAHTGKSHAYYVQLGCALQTLNPHYAVLAKYVTT